VQDTLTEKGVGMLAVYRKHCASTSSPGQLILPEALKLLPVYMNALMKTDMFRTGTAIWACDHPCKSSIFEGHNATWRPVR
jgi:protein transport protein SEC24